MTDQPVPDQPVRQLAGVGAVVVAGALTGVPMSGFVTRAAPVAVSVGVSMAAALAAWLLNRTVDRTMWSNARRVVAFVLAGFIGGVIVAVGVAAAWPGPSGGESVLPHAAVFEAMIDGWSAVATSPVPADPAPMVLVPLALVVWGAVWSGVLLRLRSGSPLAPMVPGIVAVVAASVAAGGRGGAPVLVGLGLASAVALSAATADRGPQIAIGRTAGGGAQDTRRNAIPAVVGITVAGVLIGVTLGPALTLGRDDDPFDPREVVEPSPDVSDAVNPIELVASWMQRDDTVMFTVESDVAVRTRLVALDTFDGARWRPAAEYEPSGTQLTRLPRDLIDVQPVSAHIEPAELSGTWLATVGDTVSIEGVEARFDPQTQTVVAVGGAGEGYDVESLVPRFDDPGLRARLGDLPTLHGDDARASSASLPSPPAWVAEMADAATAGASSPFEQAARLERYLRTSFALRDEPLSGHSYGQLERALLWDTAGAASPEQFAATFAVVGRSIGLPTRVVVGFGPGEEIRPGVHEVRAADVRVWPEVRFVSVGWVPFEPTPGGENTLGGAAGGEDLGVGFGDPDELPPPNDVVLPDPGDGSSDATSNDVGPAAPMIPPGEPPTPAASTWWRLPVGAVVLVALAVLPFALVAVIKRRVTARRRRRDSAGERVIGAWHDVCDRLIEFGIGDTDRGTVEEVVAEAGERAEALTGIYRPVNAALYSTATVTEDDAEQAWRARDRFVDVCRRDQPWARRIRCGVDPRPLRVKR